MRKGGRTATLVFWNFFDECESDTLDSDEEEQTRSERRRIARAYHVFNAMQVDGYICQQSGRCRDSERIAHAEEFCSLIPAFVKHGSDRTF